MPTKFSKNQYPTYPNPKNKRPPKLIKLCLWGSIWTASHHKDIISCKLLRHGVFLYIGCGQTLTYILNSQRYMFKKHLKTISYNTFLCPAISKFLVSWSVTLPVVNRHPIWSLIDILEQFDIPNPKKSKYSHLLVLRHFIKSQTHCSQI